MDNTQPPVHVAPLQPPPRPGGGVGSLFAVLFALAFLVSMAFNLFLVQMDVSHKQQAKSAGGGYVEKLIDGDAEASDKIVVIDVMGVIQSGDEQGPFGNAIEGIVTSTTRQLKEAASDPNVCAIILNIESPGGGVDASEMIYQQVKNAKERGKKIVVQMNGVAASGAYYISAPADHILAHPTTITGSIGVIMQLMVAKKALDYLNLEPVVIKAGSKKDWGAPFDEFTADERAYFQGLIDQMYDRFVTLVDEGRPNLSREQVLELATGEVYIAQTALDKGLIDGIGFIEDAYKTARDLARSPRAKVVRYHEPGFFEQLLGGEMKTPVQVNAGLQIDLEKIIEGRTPRFLYLWTTH